jgi:hypothetical protein
MNIFPPLEQRLSPFQFYADMRHNNPVAYDERDNVWAVFRYYDVQSILGNYMHAFFLSFTTEANTWIAARFAQY